jgi:hypothetical protein
MIRDLVEKTRSYRRFDQEFTIGHDTLRELVDLARLSASGANRQPLKYMLSNDAQTNALIFPHLAWASYLKDWAGPQEGERPSAYIIVLGDTDISKSFGIDPGIALQSILLGASERGLGLDSRSSMFLPLASLWKRSVSGRWVPTETSNTGAMMMRSTTCPSAHWTKSSFARPGPSWRWQAPSGQ